MSQNVTIEIPPAKIAIRALAPSVQISTPLWLYWAEIALRQEREAIVARAAADPSNPGPAMVEETQASMVALTACAHSLDGFCGKFGADIMPPALRRRWNAGAGNRAMQIWDALRHGFEPGTVHAQWKPELVWLFKDRRNPALHHVEASKDVAMHPLGTYTGQEMVDYSVEAAVRACNLLVEILDACTLAPKPPAAAKANAIRHQVDALKLKRTCRRQ